MKINEKIGVEIVGEKLKVTKGQSILDEHFLNDNGDIELKASDIFVKEKSGKIVKLYADYDEVGFDILD